MLKEGRKRKTERRRKRPKVRTGTGDAEQAAGHEENKRRESGELATRSRGDATRMMGKKEADAMRGMLDGRCLPTAPSPRAVTRVIRAHCSGDTNRDHAWFFVGLVPFASAVSQRTRP